MKNNTAINVSRRGFLTGALGLATTALGVAVTVRFPQYKEAGLDSVSRINDSVQAALFSPTTLAPVYPRAAITSPFPFNAFYPEAYAPVIDTAQWQLNLSGDIARKTPLVLADLRKMQQVSQITRLICIEGWSAVGEWSGVPLAHILAAIGANTRAPFVRFDCEDGYHTSIDMASALHPQTLLALDFLGQALTPAFGAPVRLRIPTKLGFKNAKAITHISVHHSYQGGYWEDQGYNWFAGL